MAPNIVLMLADDLGYNDVSLHGSPQVPTPHVDALAAQGVWLRGYRTQPVCSPTRASIMSGRHATHTGIYMPFARGSAARLGLNFTLLPEHLRHAGYDTHLVGKWHLGQNEVAALPTSRGFDTAYGYWTGAEDHYNHQAPQANGSYDFADGLRTCFEANGTYGSDLFTRRAVRIISGYTPSSARAFFLYLAHQNVHWPLQAPAPYLARFARTTGGDRRRQAVAAMASVLDDAVGAVSAALARQRLEASTLVLFLSDNGGPTNGYEGSWSSNYPLRGGKNTLWEGGTRAVAIARGFGVPPARRGTATEALVHCADWLPTLLHLATGEPGGWRRALRGGAAAANRSVAAGVASAAEPPWRLGDGVDVLRTITAGEAVRREVMLEAHPQPRAAGRARPSWRGYRLPPGGGWADDGAAAGPTGGPPRDEPGADVHGNALVTAEGWKLVRLAWLAKEEAGWPPPPGQDPAATPYTVGCDVGRQPASPGERPCMLGWCLFNLSADPCEYADVAEAHPAVVGALAERLAAYQATAVPIAEPEGCEPITVRGAWRPCDSPDPGGA